MAANPAINTTGPSKLSFETSMCKSLKASHPSRRETSSTWPTSDMAMPSTLAAASRVRAKATQKMRIWKS
jgi:hypothetical protein